MSPGGGVEREVASEALVEHQSYRVQIGSGIQCLALHLLWRHVFRSSDGVSFLGGVVVLGEIFGDTKIDHFDGIRHTKEYIGGFDVSVDDLGFVGVATALHASRSHLFFTPLLHTALLTLSPRRVPMARGGRRSQADKARRARRRRPRAGCEYACGCADVSSSKQHQ